MAAGPWRRKALLPASVVKQFANDRAKQIEEAEGRRVGRKEMRDLREALQVELMPRAFVQRRSTFAWIDPLTAGWPSMPPRRQGRRAS